MSRQQPEGTSDSTGGERENYIFASRVTCDSRLVGSQDISVLACALVCQRATTMTIKQRKGGETTKVRQTFSAVSGLVMEHERQEIMTIIGPVSEGRRRVINLQQISLHTLIPLSVRDGRSNGQLGT